METERIDALKRRVASDPASVSFAALAEEYRRAGQPEAAIATCRAGLAHRPDYVSARVTLGRALMEAGKAAEARAQFEMVVKAAPENLAAIRALALLHERDTAPLTVQPLAAATVRRRGAGDPVGARVVPRRDPQNPRDLAKSAHARRQLT